MSRPSRRWQPEERSRAAPTGARRGFTLLEVIVTLVIIAVMAAAAIPAFLGAERRTETDVVQADLEALFRTARDSAVLTASEVLVVVDSASGRVWFEIRRPAALPTMEDETGTLGRAGLGGGTGLGSLSDLGSRTALGAPAMSHPGREVRLELPASVRMEISRARASFLFTAAGAVMGDSIVLRAASGHARSITLGPWNGRVRAQ